MMIKIIALLLLFSIIECAGMEQQNESESHARWLVTENGSELKIAYGTGIDFPQYAALHLKDSYFRLVDSPSSVWGTSVILLPAFRSNGAYYQGAPVAANWEISGPDLVLYIKGAIGGINVSTELRIVPPENNSISAHVKNTIDGTIPLDSRPGETFKPIMLSSMHISSAMWDAQSAFANDQNYPIPISGWIITPLPAIKANTFGLLGGTSNWNKKAPTITVTLGKPMQIAGWVNQSNNSNEDNVGYWAASEEIIDSYEYTITAVSSKMPD